MDQKPSFRISTTTEVGFIKGKFTRLDLNSIFRSFPVSRTEYGCARYLIFMKEIRGFFPPKKKLPKKGFGKDMISIYMNHQYLPCKTIRCATYRNATVHITGSLNREDSVGCIKNIWKFIAQFQPQRLVEILEYDTKPNIELLENTQTIDLKELIHTIKEEDERRLAMESSLYHQLPALKSTCNLQPQYLPTYVIQTCMINIHHNIGFILDLMKLNKILYTCEFYCPVEIIYDSNLSSSVKLIFTYDTISSLDSDEEHTVKYFFFNTGRVMIISKEISQLHKSYQFVSKILLLHKERLSRRRSV